MIHRSIFCLFCNQVKGCCSLSTDALTSPLLGHTNQDVGKTSKQKLNWFKSKKLSRHWYHTFLRFLYKKTGFTFLPKLTSNVILWESLHCSFIPADLPVCFSILSTSGLTVKCKVSGCCLLRLAAPSALTKENRAGDTRFMLFKTERMSAFVKQSTE